MVVRQTWWTTAAVAALMLTLMTACSEPEPDDDTNNGQTTPVDTVDMDETPDEDMSADMEVEEDMGPMPMLSDELFAPGTFGVGFKEIEIAYPQVAPEQPEAMRTLPLKIWYPADIGADDTLAEYAVAGIITLNSEQAYAEAPAAAGGPFPVLVYSHGSGGEGLLAYPFAELFASHGWFVVSPNHVGNTAVDGIMETNTPFIRTAVNRVADISALLDVVEQGFGDELLDPLGDISRVFLFGHSFGAYTTLAAGGANLDAELLRQSCEADRMCEELENEELIAYIQAGFGDERVDAIAPQAPALVPLFGAGELAGIALPTMLQTGRLDLTTTQEEQSVPAWMGLDGADDIWVEMPTGAHFSFITICDDINPSLLRILRPGANADGCAQELIPTERAVPVLAAYLLAFGKRHILGESQWDAVLTGMPLDEGFVITTKAGE